MEKTKVIKFHLPENYKFTGREISSKLVISKNKDSKGNNITILLKYFKGRYYFVPITDIYLDYSNTILIMPQYRPVPVLKALDIDIIPSKKYDGFFVFAPDSDFNPSFKEIEFPDGKKIWVLVYNKITLYLYTNNDDLYEEGDGRGEEYSLYLSSHQINVRNKKDIQKEAIRRKEWNIECQKMTDELFEEAGYDFLD